MCAKLMNLLLNNEVKSCHEVINTFLNLLVNDSLLLRQVRFIQLNQIVFLLFVHKLHINYAYTLSGFFTLALGLLALFLG